MSDLIDRILTLTTSTEQGVVSSVGFGSALIFDGASSLDGDTYRVYNSVTDVTDDATLGHISAVASAYLQGMFGARQFSAPIYLGKFDDAGGEDPSDTFAATQQAMIDAGLAAPYWLGCTSRTDADTVALITSGSSDSFPHITVGQSSNADAITTGYPSAFSTVETNDRKVLVYDATDAAYLDADLISFQAGTNPATVAMGGHWYMGSGLESGALSDAAQGFARTNAFSTGYTARGAVNGGSRVRDYDILTTPGANPTPLYLRFTADYVADLIRVEFANIIVRYVGRNARFPGGTEGEAIIRGVVAEQCQSVTGSGDGAFLSPSFADGFDGQSFRFVSLSYNTSTRAFSGSIEINVRGQVATISLSTIFGDFSE